MTFYGALHTGLNKFRRDDCDVAIEVGGNWFHCHRTILASASGFFDSMLCRNFDAPSFENIVMTLPNIDVISLEFLVTSCRDCIIALPADIFC